MGSASPRLTSRSCGPISGPEALILRPVLIDCIAGYPLNPWTCGIAKFNDILARRLELKVVRIGAPELSSYRRPLLSLKMSEFSAEDALALDTWIERHAGEFELFLHAFEHTALEKRMLVAA